MPNMVRANKLLQFIPVCGLKGHYNSQVGGLEHEDEADQVARDWGGSTGFLNTLILIKLLHKKRIKIPANKPIIMDAELFYLCEYERYNRCGSLMYLQYIKSGSLKSDSDGDPEDTYMAQAYRADVNSYLQKLLDECSEANFDAIAGAPSGRNHNYPYLDKFINYFTSAHDLTKRFCKHPDFSAGAANCSIKPSEGIIYHGGQKLENINSLLIVDDIINTGITAATMVQHLWEDGLSRCAKINLAMPLYISVQKTTNCGL